MKRAVAPLIAIIIIGFLILGAGMLFVIGLGFEIGGERGPENVDTSIAQLNALNLPEPIKNLFIEVAGSTNVPAALLAATSFVECGRLWNVPLETISQWITSNSDVDRRGCNFNNGYNVWGPMQFLDTTWGYESGANVRARPTPKSGSIGDQVGRRTRRVPATPVNLKDAIYGAAIKHAGTKAGLTQSGASFQGKDWDNDELVREIARSYCNGKFNREDRATRACSVGNAGYGQGVLTYYKQFSETLNQ